MRIFITGDTHGQFKHITEFCEKEKTTKDDILIILGDTQINYKVIGLETENRNDIYRYEDTENSLGLKKGLSKLPITLFCIQGNHEAPAHLVCGYKLSHNAHSLFMNQNIFVQEDFPNILFAEEGCIYNIWNNSVGIIGGAYSVDKFYSLYRGAPWFKEEQPAAMKSDKVFLENLKNHNYKVNIILSHTCPYSYMPTEAFIPELNQDNIDNSTEMFLDEIEEKVSYDNWFCGHFHIHKRTDKVCFLYHNFIELLDDE